MRLPPAAGIALALVAAIVCVRLGFWQLSRLEEKRALNRALRTALVATPAELPIDALLALPAESLRVRRVLVRGRLDARRHVVLVARSRDGEPGVEVVTPLAPAAAGALVLVDRGFLPSADGATVSPGALVEPRAGAPIAVVGFAERIARRGRPGFLRRVENDSMSVWIAPWLDPDSLRIAFGEPVSALVVRELPGGGAPALPARAPPKPLDETIHLNYAVQWFSFAAIIAIGSFVLFVRSRRPRPSEVSP